MISACPTRQKTITTGGTHGMNAKGAKIFDKLPFIQ